MVRTEFRGDCSGNDKLLRLQDRWCENPVLRFFVSDQPIVRICHIGSTAIQGIWAKNIVDVMIEIPQSVDMK